VKIRAAAYAFPIVAALLASSAFARDNRQGGDQPGVFDYYALSLSWSPEYCTSRDDPVQCADGRQLGFVLHGLWPQFEKGYPDSCSRAKLPAAVRDRYVDMYPAPKLISHEWQKHGTCSGLSPEAYLALSSKLKDGLKIPADFQRPQQPVRVTPGQFEQAFRQANPALAKDSVLPFCTGGGRFLREAHACYGKDGASRSCAMDEIKRSQKSCGQASFLLKNVR
jgi:ribonuclease T2